MDDSNDADGGAAKSADRRTERPGGRAAPEGPGSATSDVDEVVEVRDEVVDQAVAAVGGLRADARHERIERDRRDQEMALAIPPTAAGGPPPAAKTRSKLRSSSRAARWKSPTTLTMPRRMTMSRMSSDAHESIWSSRLLRQPAPVLGGIARQTRRVHATSSAVQPRPSMPESPPASGLAGIERMFSSGPGGGRARAAPVVEGLGQPPPERAREAAGSPKSATSARSRSRTAAVKGATSRRRSSPTSRHWPFQRAGGSPARSRASSCR